MVRQPSWFRRIPGGALNRSFPWSQLKGVFPRSSCGRFSSHGAGPSTPRFQVPAHVAVFSLLLLPTLAFGLYADRFGPDQEQLEATIRERYSQDMSPEDQEKHRRAMQEFFQSTIMNPNGNYDQALNEVLKAGRNSHTRETTRRAMLPAPGKDPVEETKDNKQHHHAATTHGTHANQTSMSDRAPTAASPDAMKPRHKRRNKAENPVPTEPPTPAVTRKAWADQAQPVLLVTGVAAVAAALGYVLGGAGGKAR